MASELLFAESKLLLAREGTYGVDAIDAILQANLAPIRYEAMTEVTVVANRDPRDRAILRPGFSNNRAQIIPRNLTWTMAGILPVPAVAGNAPLGVADLMVGSGMTEVLGAPPATYALDTTAQAGLTAYYWKRHVDAYLWRLIYGVGIRGEFGLAGAIRDYCTFSFAGESLNYPLDSTVPANPHGWSVDLAWFDADGTILLDKDGAAVVYIQAETIDDPRGLFLEPSSVLTIDGVPFCISAFDIAHGNTVKVKEATCATLGGVANVLVTGRNITGNYTLEESGPAFNKALDILHAGSEVAATLVITDGLGSGGTTLTVTMNDLQLRSVDGPNDNEGLAAWTLPFQANADWTANQLGDNELTYVWSVTP